MVVLVVRGGRRESPDELTLVILELVPEFQVALEFHGPELGFIQVRVEPSGDGPHVGHRRRHPHELDPI